jgi:hypothetical protein
MLHITYIKRVFNTIEFVYFKNANRENNYKIIEYIYIERKRMLIVKNVTHAEINMQCIKLK